MSDQSIKLGLALGLTTMGRWRGEASMYFYPSLLLPVLPEWDRVKYPYAAIDRQGTEETGYTYFLRCTATETTVNAYNIIFHAPLYSFKVENGEWVFSSEGTDNYGATRTLHEVIWADHDVYEGGSVYLSTLTPVPAGNGLAAYQGVRLPKLPEWDRTVYPYAVIRVTSDGNYGLLIASAPFYFGENSLQFKGDGCGYQYKVADSMWTENGSFAIFADYTKLSGFTPIWGNHDVLSYEDDSLYIAKSAPISVYE